MTPRAYQSLSGTAAPSACSGAMYSTVPQIPCSTVRGADVGGAVSGCDACRDLTKQRPQPLDAVRALAQVLEESDPVYQLHGVEPVVVPGHQLVERDKIRVHHVGEGAEFLLQTVDGGGVRPQQRLQCDNFVALAVLGGVHDTHPAGAEPPEQSEPRGPPELSGCAGPRGWWVWTGGCDRASLDRDGRLGGGAA